MNPSDHVDATSKPSPTASPGLKEKVIEEFKVFWVIAIYLDLVFSAFIWGRDLIVAQYGISYLQHGAALIEALILAKVILIGQAMGLGKQYEGEPLILSVLFKSVVFAVFVAFFSVIEHLVEGLIHRQTWGGIAHGLVTGGRNLIIARTLAMLAAFIPFFAFLETGRVIGDHKLFNLFFRRRAV